MNLIIFKECQSDTVFAYLTNDFEARTDGFTYIKSAIRLKAKDLSLTDLQNLANVFDVLEDKTLDKNINNDSMILNIMIC